ncbi:alpha-1A adrenergic receptor-like [Lampetra fluviatilis]
MKNSSWGVTNAPLSISAVTPAPDANGTSQSPQQQQLLLLLQDQARVVGLVLTLGSFIVFAIAGNVLVILSVFCNRHLRTVTNYFIANLALADLLLSTTVLPFSAALEVMGYWAFGRPFCDVWAAVDVLCCSASIMSLCVISVDRYVGVGYPLRYPAIMTERRALFVLVSVWVLSIVISVGPLLGWKEPPPDDETICSITEEPGYALFSSMLSFYIPMCVILGMYCKVYTAAKRQTESLKAGVKRARANMREVTLRIHRGRDDGSAKEPHHLRGSLSVRILKFSREKKAAKTVGIVVGVFVLCWFPFFLVLPLARSSSAPSSTSCAVGAVRSTTVPPGGATAPSVADFCSTERKRSSHSYQSRSSSHNISAAFYLEPEKSSISLVDDFYPARERSSRDLSDCYRDSGPPVTPGSKLRSFLHGSHMREHLKVVTIVEMEQ